MSASAITIYQDFLDHMGEALINRDAEALLRHVFLPHTILTETDVIEFDTMETALLHFDGFAGALAAQSVDACTRVARTARFDGDTSIVGQHDSSMSSGGKLAVPVFSNEMEIEMRDGIWGATISRHKTRYVSWPHVLPRSKGAPNAD